MNRSDVIQTAGECRRVPGANAPCRTCGRRPQVAHFTAGEFGARCELHCSACHGLATLDVEALAGVMTLVDD